MTPSENDRRIGHIEYPAQDLSTTKAFYTSLFGWAFEDYGPEYTSSHDGRLAGGFFTSNDLELMKANVLKLGAKLTKDIFEFPGGRRFQFLDPNGHELSIGSNP